MLRLSSCTHRFHRTRPIPSSRLLLSRVYAGLWQAWIGSWHSSQWRIFESLHLLQVLCVLPQCVDVVEGVLGADLIGFHTYNYLCHWWIQLELSVLCWDLIHHYVWHIICFLSHFSPPFPSYLLSFILLLDHNDHTFCSGATSDPASFAYVVSLPKWTMWITGASGPNLAFFQSGQMPGPQITQILP